MARTAGKYSTLLLAGLALTLFQGAKSGCGSKESKSTWESPVQAVATILEHSDGSVEAELVLISTATSNHQFVDTAENVQLRIPGGDIVALELSSDGHYTASSADHPELAYVADESYRFTFELNDEDAAGQAAGKDFYAVAEGPSDDVSFSVSELPEFAHDTSTIEWSPSSLYALVSVEDADGNEVYRSFDFENPTFDGDKWAHLVRGGTFDLTGAVFADAGDYTVTVCAVKRVSDFDTKLSSDLGVLSGFLIGRCAAPQTVSVPED